MRVKAGNRADARHPLTELFPDGINAETQGVTAPSPVTTTRLSMGSSPYTTFQAGPHVPPKQ